MMQQQRFQHQHAAPSNDEEEQLMIALALSASLAETQSIPTTTSERRQAEASRNSRGSPASRQNSSQLAQQPNYPNQRQQQYTSNHSQPGYGQQQQAPAYLPQYQSQPAQQNGYQQQQQRYPPVNANQQQPQQPSMYPHQHSNGSASAPYGNPSYSPYQAQQSSYQAQKQQKQQSPSPHPTYQQQPGAYPSPQQPRPYPSSSQQQQTGAYPPYPSATSSSSGSQSRPQPNGTPLYPSPPSNSHSHSAQVKPSQPSQPQLQQQSQPSKPASTTSSILPGWLQDALDLGKPSSSQQQQGSTGTASSGGGTGSGKHSSKPSLSGPLKKRMLHPDKTKCAGCGHSILWGQKLTALERLWHPDCFVCGFCSEGINEGGNTKFAIGHEDGWPYHMDCYKLKYHPVCSVCQEFVPAQSDGRVEYKQQAFWRETYCAHHSTDGTPQCCACTRYQQKGADFPQLSDGRHVCLICLGTLVMDTRDAQPLYKQVLAFYRNMGMPHPEEPPFMLVDAFTLNDYSNREGKDVSGGPVFHVRGLTLATVYRSIPSIVRAVGGQGGLGVSSVATALPGAERVMCDVSAILVLYGLPRLLTGCIMAHELMHAWLRMKHVAGLDTKVEEGLCQLMAYVWLDTQSNGLTDPVQQRLASFFAYQIREDLSDVYGNGFREAYDAFQQRGLGAVINDVLRRGRFT